MNYLLSLPVFLGRTLVSVSTKNIVEMSGYMAFSTLLAFFPFLMFLVSLSSFLISPEIIQSFLQEVNQVVPSEVAATLNPVIQEVLESTNTSLLTLSIVSALIISSSGVEALRSGLNDIFSLKETRGFFWRRLQDVLFVFIGAIAFLLASLSIIVIPLVIHSFEEILPYFPEFSLLHISLIRYGITFFILAWVAALFYKVLPNHKKKYKQCLPGGYIAAAIWMGVASLFPVYLAHFSRYNVIYGSLTGVIVTLLFFQLTAMILLFGAQYNMEIFKKDMKKSLGEMTKI